MKAKRHTHYCVWVNEFQGFDHDPGKCKSEPIYRCRESDLIELVISAAVLSAASGIEPYGDGIIEVERRLRCLRPRRDGTIDPYLACYPPKNQDDGPKVAAVSDSSETCDRGIR